MTLRELWVVAQGVKYQHELARRVAYQGAWITEMLSRQKRLPNLRKFLRDSFPPARGSHEAEQEWNEYAARHAGRFKVIRGGR